ncbi:phosphotransferase [Curtobacterium sp. NPDC087082]|uniref:phosphotransferase n=1 Tax=Curtobacterium sp. NPDC087082 TaxID=3363966 RepID=UPI0038130700
MDTTMVDDAWLSAVMRSIGGTPTRLEPLPGGTVNHTFRVERAGGNPVVLRYPVDPLRADEFPVEAWAADAAARTGIATAEPLAHGVEGGVPFSLSTYVAPDDRAVLRPWSWLGAYARTVARVPLHDAPLSLYSRFGKDLHTAWAAHLDYNRTSLGPDDVLFEDGAYEQRAVVDRMFAHLASGTYEHGLAHGDLAPRNLISRGPEAPPVLIDWGGAETGPTPWTDARRVFEWCFIDESVDRQEYADFVEAAGLGSDRARDELAMMTALHLVDVTRWALDNRADLYAGYVQRCRDGLDVIQELIR